MILGAEDHRFEVYQWLSPTNVKDDLFNHQNDYMDSSCDWALQTQELKGFLTSHNEKEFSGVGGHPGVGSLLSLLSSSVV
jgi:hypothetical protein